MKRKFHFYYKDSSGQRLKVDFCPSSHRNLMELIFDKVLEDWGDCRGRAWCATCHISVASPKNEEKENLESDEEFRLQKLSNRVSDSRLACQILVTEELHEMEFEFLGAD